MTLSRREVLSGGLALSATLLVGSTPKKRKRLGIGISSYAIRSRHERAKGFRDPLRFAEFCAERGAGGIQIPLGVREESYLGKLRAFLEKKGMFLEGSVRLPKEKKELDRFAAEVKTAKAAGATVVRTVQLGGRRYEVFDSLKAFREFAEQTMQSLEMAAPVMQKHRLRLAVENHKDFRFATLVKRIEKVSNEYVGVCVDTGNNLALLDDPLETVKALAKYAYSCHLKDMAVKETPGGFLLSEVPLGDGDLDLPKMVATLLGARPELEFSLEMITRDPLSVPILSKKYVATMADAPWKDVVRMLDYVKKHGRKELPSVGELAAEKKLEVEEQNVRRSLAYAREKLGL